MAWHLAANNAAGHIEGAIDDVTTTIVLEAGDGAMFPNPTGGDAFWAILFGSDPDDGHEIVEVTARSTDTLTVVRGDEGSSASSWPDGTKFDLVVSAGMLTEMQAAIDAAGLSAWTASGADIYRASGNVGIGAAPTQGEFHIQGTGSVYQTIEDTGTGYARLYFRRNSTWVGNIGSTVLGEFGIGSVLNQTDLVIDSSGNVGIGGTPSIGLLDLVDASAMLGFSGGGNNTIRTNGNMYLDIDHDNDGSNFFQVRGNANGVNAMRINDTGEVLVGHTAILNSDTPNLQVYDSSGAGFITCWGNANYGYMRLARNGVPSGNNGLGALIFSAINDSGTIISPFSITTISSGAWELGPSPPENQGAYILFKQYKHEATTTTATMTFNVNGYVGINQAGGSGSDDAPAMLSVFRNTAQISWAGRPISSNGNEFAILGTGAAHIGMSMLLDDGSKLTEGLYFGWTDASDVDEDVDSGAIIYDTAAEEFDITAGAVEIMTIDDQQVTINHGALIFDTQGPPSPGISGEKVALFCEVTSAGDGTLSIDAEESVDASAPTITHRFPIIINGTEYYIGLDPV